MAEGVGLSNAALWLWSESFAFDPALSRPASRTAFESSFCSGEKPLSNKAYLNTMGSAEGVRFELTRPFGLPVFKTGAFNRSATPPRK